MMENLINDLKSKFILQRKNELIKAHEYKDEKDKDLLLITTGKILELDHIINCLNDMQSYHQKINKDLK